MSSSLDYFRETHLIGRRCRERIIGSGHFPALRNAPFSWIGYSVLRSPYRMVRFRSTHSHIVASISGSGRALIDGKVVEWKPGQVLLGPVAVPHAFEIQGHGPWVIAWVFFDDTLRSPVLQGRQAELIEADATDFAAMIQMLLREAAGAAQPAMMTALATALNTYARRLAGNDQVDLRLWQLWEKVEADLSHPWAVAELARLAHMSEEHLRRLCHKHYQRSAMDHLTHLRLMRASTMLRVTRQKVDEIAQQVGYASMYSFSTAFRRWSGLAPTHFRILRKV
jgi:AraC-like DNA-binding protein